MMLGEHTMDAASAANVCIAYLFGALRDCADTIHALENPSPEQCKSITREIREWLTGPASSATWLLRRALREELGTAGPLADRAAYVKALVDAHAARRQSGPRWHPERLARIPGN